MFFGSGSSGQAFFYNIISLQCARSSEKTLTAVSPRFYSDSEKALIMEIKKFMRCNRGSGFPLLNRLNDFRQRFFYFRIFIKTISQPFFHQRPHPVKGLFAAFFGQFTRGFYFFFCDPEWFARFRQFHPWSLRCRSAPEGTRF